LSIIFLATIYDIFKRVKLHFENANKQEEVNSAVVAEGSFLIIEQEKKLIKKGLLYLVDTNVMRNYLKISTTL
jgi:hypothetical protein